jgi:excisionase family DNA binding protein
MVLAEKGTQRRTVTIKEAAKILGIGRDQAYNAARLGQLPVIKIGRRLLVSLPALTRMLEEAGRTAEGLNDA